MHGEPLLHNAIFPGRTRYLAEVGEVTSTDEAIIMTEVQNSHSEVCVILLCKVY